MRQSSLCSFTYPAPVVRRRSLGLTAALPPSPRASPENKLKGLPGRADGGDLPRFFVHKEKLHLTKRIMASSRVRRIHTTLHGVLKAAQKAHLIASNPTEQIIAPKFGYGAKQILTDK